MPGLGFMIGLWLMHGLMFRHWPGFKLGAGLVKV